ncbi:MAG: 5-demethoxyubiquinol-8 5-hydroxylase UbiM, partial [Gammaproteobacteria bacterium]|nr:5-demethoxyubiquinol-8 5-hydroxylase UbiM [Gammaproteobacteria bacterium]
MTQEQDATIIGAGPAGLSLAIALAEAGFRVTVIEQLPQAVLADPPPDGREIALTHRAVDILKSLGMWQRFPDADISPIREARVIDGKSPHFLGFDTRGTRQTELGYLVPNHVIRKAAFEEASTKPAIQIISGMAVSGVATTADAAEVRLADGRVLHAPLMVAADSRFSDARRRMGIGADMRDFGRTVIVCRLSHERPHEGIAHECFHYGRTLAVLPLNGLMSSAVITLSADQADAVLRMPEAEFGKLVSEQFESRLGAMQLVGKRHSYPLVAVYAQRFVAHRFALLGDAAVGMHPVTAHGFNCGLYGVESLTRAVHGARAAGRDIGSTTVLARYQSEHRRATRPIYLGTNVLVSLFTDDQMPARFLRTAVLRLANRLPPLKAGITRQL